MLFDELHAFVCLLCMNIEVNRYAMTLLQSYSEWRPLIEEMQVPIILFKGEELCPGMTVGHLSDDQILF